MSTTTRASLGLLPRRSEVGEAVSPKAAANPHWQAKGFGSVLKNVQTAETESRRQSPQGKPKPKNQRTGGPGHSGCPDDRDPTNLLSSFPPWMRAEGAVQAEPVHPTSSAPRSVVAPSLDRVLLGTGGSAPEARVRIGEGPLAGTEIQLVAVPGGVEARVLTVHEGSRQTLCVAMDEIAQRLRRKGHSLRMNSSAGRGQGRDRDDSRSHSVEE